jgi:hypothetical protein
MDLPEGVLFVGERICYLGQWNATRAAATSSLQCWLDLRVVSTYTFETRLVAFLLLLAGNFFRQFYTETPEGPRGRRFAKPNEVVTCNPA